MRNHWSTASVLLLVIAVAGCTNEPTAPASGPATVSAATGEAGTGTATPPGTGDASTPTGAASFDDAETEIPFGAATSPTTADPSTDAMLTVTDVRVGHHDGFDRVVFTLGGTGTPGWRVEYVTDPADDGSGNPVDITGDSFIQVMITGSGYPTDTGIREYSGPDPVTAAGTQAITQARLRGVFEGSTQAFIGVNGSPRPLRVFALTDPTRVVVDVQNG